MDCIEVIQHGHYLRPFRDSHHRKEILHLLNSECDADLASSFEFAYVDLYGIASRPTPLSRPMPTPVAMSRAMLSHVERHAEKHARQANDPSGENATHHAMCHST